MEIKASKEFVKKYNQVLTHLKAPKNQVNKFGGFKYRSCEDIQEGIKKCLLELKMDDVASYCTDEVVVIGNRFYVKATAVFTDGENTISATGYAREPEVRTKMDEAQVTGSSSSYARKYALNGLYSIDDTKIEATPELDAQDNKEPNWKTKLQSIKSVEELQAFWNDNVSLQRDKTFIAEVTAAKSRLQ